MEMTIDKNGKVTIPKELRDKYNLNKGIKVSFSAHKSCMNHEIIMKPIASCCRCGKALPPELEKRRACIGCEPPKEIFIY